MKIRLCILILCIFVAFIFNFARKLGFMTVLKPFPQDSDCIYHDEKFLGPEDITKLTENILVGISNDFISLIHKFGVSETPQGFLWVYYLDNKISKRLQIDGYPSGQNFFPHGIYYENSTQKLHVINHPFEGKGDRIEVFKLNLEDLDNIKIQFLTQYNLPKNLTGALNDLILLTNGEYLITESNAYASDLVEPRPLKFLQKFQEIERLLSGSISRQSLRVFNCLPDESNQDLDCIFDKSSWGELNNGINWNKKDTVLVADSIGKKVRVYKLNFKTKDRSQRLVQQQEINTNCHPDNIEYDSEKNYYTTTGFGKIHQFFDSVQLQLKTHPEYPEKVEDSWLVVDRIIPQENDSYKVENILTTGNSYRGASVAIEYQNEIILGSFMDKSIATCKSNGVNPDEPFIHSFTTLVQQQLN